MASVAPNLILAGLKRLWRCRRGGVAVPFAIVSVPILFALLGSLDFHHASQVRSSLQDALDAATLAVGRSQEVDATKVQSIGDDTLKSNLINEKNMVLTGTSFTVSDGRVTAWATAKVDAVAADVFLGDQINVRADAQADRARRKLEIALVLDNTGSMAGTKLSTLKSAGKTFVDEMEKAADAAGEAGIIKIAVAPFSMTVNVGPAYQTADWIDGHLDSGGNPVAPVSPVHQEIFTSTANRFALLKQMNQTWGGCVESRPMPYDVQETAPSAATPSTLFVPFFAPDEPDITNGGFYNNYLTDAAGTSGWQQRQGNPAKYNVAPNRTGPNSVGYQYGPNSGCALAPVLRLTSDFNAVRTRLTEMTAIGDTNIPMGLVWGWHLLSPNAPFKDGVAYGGDEVQKIVVLMTDGQNANADTNNSDDSIYSGVGYIWQNRLGITSGSAAARSTAIDNRLTLLCQNMKAKGIILYTVRVEVTTGTNTVLKACATRDDMFYDVQQVSELSNVFTAIAGSIQELRLIR